MEIAIISEHASPLSAIGGKDAGGQNIYVSQLAKHLVLLGHQVEVFTRKESEEVPLIVETEDGYRVINVIAGPQRPMDKEKILPFMNDFSRFIVDYLNKHQKKIDVIHANFWMSGIVAMELKKELKIPFAITFHALGRVRRLHQGKDDGFPDERFHYEDLIMNHADMIIAECPQDEEDLLHLYKVDSRKIKIIPCGFDSEEMFPVDKEKAKSSLGIDPRVSVILHLGRMVPRKGADNVIRGFAHYLKSTQKECKLVIVGGESDEPCPIITPELGRLQLIAQEEGVLEKVIFTGRRSRPYLKHYYSAADVFVTTPWYEPFGITPLEAMACATPVIGANVGGIKYSIVHGKTGLLVPPNNPHALKKALVQILDNSSYRRELSRNALERVNTLFRWEQMAFHIEKQLMAISYSSRKNLYLLNQEVLNEKRQTLR